MREKEDLAVSALTDFLNSCEAGIIAARQRIKSAKGLWDASKIRWSQAEGPKGPYQLSGDENNPEFKAMLKDLTAHGGKLTGEGWFYWAFKSGSTVGRKKQK